jgi:hypothetical protein
MIPKFNKILILNIYLLLSGVSDGVNVLTRQKYA